MICCNVIPSSWSRFILVDKCDVLRFMVERISLLTHGPCHVWWSAGIYNKESSSKVALPLGSCNVCIFFSWLRVTKSKSITSLWKRQRVRDRLKGYGDRSPWKKPSYFHCNIEWHGTCTGNKVSNVSRSFRISFTFSIKYCRFLCSRFKSLMQDIWQHGILLLTRSCWIKMIRVLCAFICPRR